MSILKFIAACAAACALVCAPAAHAAVETAKPKAEAKKKPAAKQSRAKPAAKSKSKPAPVAPAVPDPEADEPTELGSTVVDYDCELGNKITIYQNAGDESHVALRWKQRLHRLTRVATTTGAQRFENKFHGLIWIGIPAKGMLLDSKKNRQLANECRNAEQLNPAPAPIEAAAPVAPAASPAPAVPATSAAQAQPAPSAPGAHM
ncbi:MliC family protein [Pseudoduganella albidiflava]|uniref:C-type lysozyme inhibitor domain-containing protein n=1 Tax=Pseudoduganella albidiflava TaxID=321983 RepID=A0AA87XUT1_9BURK|nr:MliC family protein [Pseudoduganella albidiflava]GGY53827.1 hypothetical protein GCM10007387_40400 [Pseudoduganella albidiflava]